MKIINPEIQEIQPSGTHIKKTKVHHNQSVENYRKLEKQLEKEKTTTFHTESDCISFLKLC